MNTETLLFLFNSYCKPVYGLNLYTHAKTLNSCKFKTFELAYNNALKKIANVPRYTGNHEVADKTNQFLLRHHLALLQGNYCNRLLMNRCPVIKLNLPFLKGGLFFNHIRGIFKDKYSIDVCNIAPDILCSRVSWVQKHEERRAPVFVNMVN